MNPATAGEGGPEEKAVAVPLTTRSRLESDLLRLPGELRNQIYEYVLKDLAAHLRCDSSPRAVLRPIWKRHALALTQVCVQVRTETKALPTICTDFTGHVKHLWDYLIMPGGVLSSRELQAFTTIRIEVDGYHYAKYGMLALHMRDILGILAKFPGLERIIVIPDRTTSRFSGSESMWRLMEQDVLDVLNRQFRQLLVQLVDQVEGIRSRWTDESKIQDHL